jgi:23S rRNA G2069 N7-methylase RlmK/C1962 C5-methylase RlmI
MRYRRLAGYGGTVSKAADELNRKGSKWDYVISDPTSYSLQKERYALFGKPPHKKNWKSMVEKISFRNRTFYCTFEYKKK